MSTAKINWAQRLASRLVLGYVRNVPVGRGKHRLLSAARRFLVAELEPGLYIRVADLEWVERNVIRHGSYERDTMEVFASLLAPGMTVFDVGANVGPYALVAARRVGDRGSVHAFEPTPKSAAGLRR